MSDSEFESPQQQWIFYLCKALARMECSAALGLNGMLDYLLAVRLRFCDEDLMF